MSISVTLEIDGTDFSSRLSTYRVNKEVTYKKVTTTLSGREITNRMRVRPIVVFTLIPYTDSQAADDFDVLNKPVHTVRFTDPDSNDIITKEMRLVSNLSHVFGIDSIDGNRYYKGGEIQLRSNTII